MEIDEQEEEGLKLNPWAVEALEEFLYFCCPECNIKSTDKDAFVNHVWSNHPKVSGQYLHFKFIYSKKYVSSKPSGEVIVVPIFF